MTKMLSQQFDGILFYKTSILLAYVVIAFSNNVLMCPRPFLRGTGVFLLKWPYLFQRRVVSSSASQVVLALSAGVPK